jgi:hypothetical protein
MKQRRVIIISIIIIIIHGGERKRLYCTACATMDGWMDGWMMKKDDTDTVSYYFVGR